MKAAADLYSGHMDMLTLEGASSVKGYTLGAGTVRYLEKRRSSLVGPWRPFVYGGMSYRKIKGNLAYPVRDFHSALGLDLGMGVEWRQLDVRLGYTWAIFDESCTTADYYAAASSDDMDLSAVTMEVSWKLPHSK